MVFQSGNFMRLCHNITYRIVYRTTVSDYNDFIGLLFITFCYLIFLILISGNHKHSIIWTLIAKIRHENAADKT